MTTSRIVRKVCEEIVSTDNSSRARAESLPRPVLPPDARSGCCDVCQKDRFPVEHITLDDPTKLRGGRRPRTSQAMQDAARSRLEHLRDGIVQRKFPRQMFLTGQDVMSDSVLDGLAKGTSYMKTVDDVRSRLRWYWLDEYDEEVLAAIHEVREATLAGKLEPSDHSDDGNSITAGHVANELTRTAVIVDSETRERLKTLFERCLSAVGDLRNPNGAHLCTKHLHRVPRKLVGLVIGF